MKLFAVLIIELVVILLDFIVGQFKHICRNNLSWVYKTFLKIYLWLQNLEHRKRLSIVHVGNFIWNVVMMSFFINEGYSNPLMSILV